MDLMYLENLDEFINDEKRIVTYRWLSLTLNVSSNVAKQMLFHYYDKHKNSSDGDSKLSVSYFLSGIKHNKDLEQDIQKVCIVRDEDLEEVKSRFKKIFSLHIYSIQRGRLRDLHILYGTDYDKIKENVLHSAKYSGITCPSASIRSSEQTTTLQNEDINTMKEPPTDAMVNPRQEDGAENKENKSSEQNVMPKRSPKKTAKGAISLMFANQTKKLEAKNLTVKKSGVNSNSSLKSSNSKPTAKKGSLSAFLTKAQPPIHAPKQEEKRVSQEEELSPKEEEEKETTTILKETEDKGKKKPQSPKRKPNSKPKEKRKCLQKSSSSNSKRRRIRIMDSSSESSSEEEEELMEECPIPSPVNESAVITIKSDDDDDDVIPPTPQDSARIDDVTKVRKGRRRKLVDKTFIDECEYFVTKKEYEFVTDSDEENPIPSPVRERISPKTEKVSPQKKKSLSPKRKKTKISPTKSKQSSITSFFKKK